MPKTILVTGATGRQGGAVVKALQGSEFDIIALTRSTTSPAAQKLSATYPNVKLLQGDLANAAAIFEQCKTPIWGVYSVQAQVQGPDKSQEEFQGKAIIDQALANNVQFFVYSSVDRGGDKSSETPTTVSHWVTKYNIEKYLIQKTNGTNMRYGILRPTAFMEGFTDDFMGKALASMWKSALPEDKPLQLVATKDIGWFAAYMFKNSDRLAGQAISLAGAELTYTQATEVFKHALGKDMPETFSIVAHMILHAVKDVNAMFKWLKKEGTKADIAELRSIHPEMTDFGTWLKTESQFR
ncbi:NmrA-like family protein [Aaosphaeria arxii CBS 175.79]|uniref:NmrA-like family protein n=1 Tax=Aaosphaeria arxii CBS 175.79 TaxID=1450172 RepID=A0A6A5Y4H4_9PLEO|nr:NmrA-like family protein [Aaosphaeria arxii CBS 175.79]KAF2019414.1 NmrA-like family protein [Aaosphaeria arxii CBS 175.79]